MKRIAVLLLVVLLGIGMATCAEEQQLTAAGYVLVTAGTESRWFPLPTEEEGEYSFTVRRTSGDTEMNNTITVTPEGVYMAESDCDNQDCIGEGEITLENMSTRILGNLIICLPHQIQIELYTREELESMLAQSSGATE